MRRLISSALVLVMAAGCSPEREMRLYVFDCGRARFTSVVPFGLADDETDIREGPFPCYVVEHPRGRLLWDGGIPSAMARTSGWHETGPGFWVRLDRTLADQLADVRLTLDSIDYVAFSHMHFDHVGVGSELRRGTLLFQQAEHDAYFAAKVTVPFFDTTAQATLRTMQKRVVTGDHDVFGDGRVRIIATPGHTPGHQSLLVRLAETGAVVLSGDVYHFQISRERQRMPVWNVDTAQSRASMRRLEALLEQERAQLWIHHDPVSFAAQKKAPAYYR